MSDFGISAWIIRTLKERRSGMEITDIRVRKVTCGGKPKAYVTVTFDDCFVVHNIKIIEGKTGVFIAMPSRKTRAGEYKDVAHPIHPEFRAELQRRILDKYDSGDVMDDGVDDPSDDI
jgi:stage V sporulation protein G